MLGYIPKTPIVDRPSPARSALIALCGAVLAAVMTAWVALLGWLVIEGVTAIAHWL